MKKYAIPIKFIICYIYYLRKVFMNQYINEVISIASDVFVVFTEKIHIYIYIYMQP